MKDSAGVSQKFKYIIIFFSRKVHRNLDISLKQKSLHFTLNIVIESYVHFKNQEFKYINNLFFRKEFHNVMKFGSFSKS